MDVFAKSFSDIVIDPKGYFLCDFNQIEDGVFEKSPLFGIPYFGQKLHFFGPEGPILTQNLKNIVELVVISQNNQFQGLNWSSKENGNFGVVRPPQTTQGPPRAPSGVQRAQIWL